ncbi:MAG: 50S ribosomal protein L6 [Gammaproteobacteria bacterium]
MSRIAKNPIQVPAGVAVDIQDTQLTIKSSKGALQCAIPADVRVTRNDDMLQITMHPEAKAVKTELAGTMHSNINNMIKGITTGFVRTLELIGVGYRAQTQGQSLQLTLGFSHPVAYSIPAGITIETPTQTEIVIKGFDKRLVGQVAAEIRKYRMPEPYKGKGVRFKGQVIKLKETKKK